MNTKSKIQVINEAIKIRNDFKEALEAIMDKYVIEDAIFAFRDGKIVEAVGGYFVQEKECKHLFEAVSEGLSKGVRIVNNEKFYTGDIYEIISMCPTGSKILDINNLEEIG